MDYIVQLATLAELTKDITTKEYIKNLRKCYKDSYNTNGCSVLKALEDGLVFDLLVTVSRLTHKFSKIYDIIPEEFMPGFVKHSVPYGAAGILADYHRSQSLIKSLYRIS